MKKFYYIRDFSADLGLDNVSIIERLMLSSTLTKYLDKDDRDSAEIVFGTVKALSRAYRNWISYRDFVAADDRIKQSKRCSLYDTVIKTAEKDPKMLHYVKIDISMLNMDGRNSLTNIAWRAFALAASMHSVNSNNDWFDLDLLEWNKNSATNRKRTLTEIEAFLKETDIYAQLIGKRIVRIFNKRAQDVARSQGGPHLICEGDALQAIKKEAAVEPIVEEEAPIEEAEDEELDDVEKEWLANEESLSEDETIDGEKSIFKYDDSDDISKYTHEDWKKLYEAKREQHKNMARIITYVRAAWGDINDEVMKIAKKLKVKEAVIKKFIETGYVDGRDGGYEMKQKIRDEIKKLQEHIMMAREDTSWQDKYYPELGNILVAFAHYSHEKLMEVK